MIGPQSLSPHGTLQLWWVTRRAETANQNQILAEPGGGIWLGKLIGLEAATANKRALAHVRAEDPGLEHLQALLPVPTLPPHITMQFLTPAPMPALLAPSSARPKWLAPGAAGDQGLFVFNHNGGVLRPFSCI